MEEFDIIKLSIIKRYGYTSWEDWLKYYSIQEDDLCLAMKAAYNKGVEDAANLATGRPKNNVNVYMTDRQSILKLKK